MKNRPVAPVSVVIPCYRCFDTISRAVESVYAQTVLPVEVVLVDDFSNDGTLEKLLDLQKKYPEGWIDVIPLPINDGPGTARNKGWEKSKQPYIAFLDSDDAWHPQKIEFQVDWMQRNPDVALTGHAFINQKKDSNWPYKCLKISHQHFIPVKTRQLIISNRFATRSVILRSSLPHRFVEGKRHSEDFLLWCEICLDGYLCYHSHLPLACTFKASYGEGGLSQDLWKMQRGQLDSYKRLKRSSRIKTGSLIILYFWSFIRFIRRFLIVKTQR